MNIDIIGNHGANHVNDMEHITYERPSFSASRTMTEKTGYSLDITGKVKENAAYGKEDLKSAQDIAQMAGMTNVSVQSDYMAVMSNSMSDEDFAELVKDGANPTKIPAGEAVTNLDRIKIRMAEAGTTIAGYNDDLTEEDIKAVYGNSINSGKILSDMLSDADLPATGDNISGIKETVMMAQNLKPLTDEAKAYMVSEELSPTIENLYKAEYSAASKGFSSQKVHYEGAATYAGAELTMSKWDDLSAQALEVIKEADLPDEQAALSDARTIAGLGLPITKETLTAYADIKDISLPADPKDLLAAVTVALEEGKSPREAVLDNTKSLYTRAAEIVEVFKNMEDPADITRRRQLEEVRLAMTAEANLTLLRKGINIETQPLEQLVEQLKDAERQFWAPLLSPENNAGENQGTGDIVSDKELDERIDLFRKTQTAVRYIPEVPVRVIAERAGSDDFNLEGIERQGRNLQGAYEKAGEAYETLMTAPRADMGDSITKAFRNVDDILADLDMDTNEANRKAVRTLGYAGMMISRESVDEIRQATASVERVISLMTPARTLQMIRQGQNPLSENIFELEKKLSEEPFEESTEKYSKFLLRLERSGNITDDEKKAFIGMYRLFNTIEKRDGKVIGNVLNTGEELTLSNMLKASRSNRHTNGEYVIDDDFGFLEELNEKGETITSQIERVFPQLIDPAADKDYVAEKQRDIRAAAKAPKEAQDILSMAEAPVTVENILAVTALTGGMGKGYKKLFSGERSFEGSKDDDRKRLLTDEDAAMLADSLTDRESLQASYESFLDKAAEVAKENAGRADSYEDVRTLSMLYKQVGFASALSRNESYEIPVKLDEGWTSIHLTIVHSDEESSKVKASFESDIYGRVDATFSLRSGGADGFIVSDSRAGVENLKGIDDKIKEGLSREHIGTANLSYVFSNSSVREGYLPESDHTKASDSTLYKMAKAFIGAVQTASQA